MSIKHLRTHLKVMLTISGVNSASPLPSFPWYPRETFKETCQMVRRRQQLHMTEDTQARSPWPIKPDKHNDNSKNQQKLRDTCDTFRGHLQFIYCSLLTELKRVLLRKQMVYASMAALTNDLCIQWLGLKEHEGIVTSGRHTESVCLL